MMADNVNNIDCTHTCHHSKSTYNKCKCAIKYINKN